MTFVDSKPHCEILDGLRGVAALVVVVFGSIALAWLCLKFYDIPLRKYLTEKWLKQP
jgi:peptidoglycan/LPS O-acetylase OafA/YrhL